ncbi:MAG: hypothetical protein ACRYFB_08855 [Janthinobacterium lividum]
MVLTYNSNKEEADKVVAIAELPDDIDSVVTFLCTDDAGLINRQTH